MKVKVKEACLPIVSLIGPDWQSLIGRALIDSVTRWLH